MADFWDDRYIDLFNFLPAIVHINEISEGIPLAYLNVAGLKILGITETEFKEFDKIELSNSIVDFETARSIIPLLFKFISERDSEKTLTFFQKLKNLETGEHFWVLTSSRIFKEKYLISFSNTISTMAYDRERVEQFLEERVLAFNYNEKFNTLTKQEKAILSLIGKGYDSKSISTKLGNTPKTVNNIRNNIKQKLEMSGRLPSMTELVQFARIFNI